MRRGVAAIAFSGLTLVLALVLATRALLPALPMFVCLQMDGARLSAPCCPTEAAQPGEAPAWAPRCCELQAPLLMQQARPLDHRAAPLLPAAAWTLGLPVLPLATRLPALGRDGPPASGPPPPLRQVLRI